MFNRAFDEIWQVAPFRPTRSVDEFIDRFMEGPRFNADLFWEYVANAIEQRKRESMDRGSSQEPTGNGA